MLDRIASAVDQHWTPGLVSLGVRFIDGHLPANLAAVATEKFDRIVAAYVFGQGQLANPGLDPRPVIRRAMTALRPLVAPGGDVIVLDYFHDRDTKLAESINAAAQRAGFGKTVKGWKLQDPEAPWQLRFVTEGGVV